MTMKDLDTQSNITDKVIDTICRELSRMGLYRRPLHCLDSKRKKTCIRENNEWTKNDDKLLTTGIKKMSNKFQASLREWSNTHPGWAEDQALAEEYMDIVRLYITEPVHDKCITQLLRATPIKT